MRSQGRLTSCKLENHEWNKIFGYQITLRLSLPKRKTPEPLSESPNAPGPINVDVMDVPLRLQLFYTAFPKSNPAIENHEEKAQPTRPSSQHRATRTWLLNLLNSCSQLHNLKLRVNLLDIRTKESGLFIEFARVWVWASVNIQRMWDGYRTKFQYHDVY